MSNGTMLNELRELAKVEGRVPTSTALRLMLSSMADQLEQIGDLTTKQEARLITPSGPMFLFVQNAPEK